MPNIGLQFINTEHDDVRIAIWRALPGDNGQNAALVPGFPDPIAEKQNNRLRECLEFDQWLLCAAMASVVLWYCEVL